MRTVVYLLCLLSIAFAKTHLVLQITDIHLEPDYRAEMPALCESRPCCRKDSVAVNVTYPAPIYGDHNCDSSPEFFVDSLQYLREFFDSHPNLRPDFILATGDEPPHRKRETQTQEMNVEVIRYVYGKLKEAFGDYRVFPTFGNHDTWPEGRMSVPPENRWMTEVMADLWKSWISEDQMENVLYGGYYTMLIEPGWRLISMNCLWHYDDNERIAHLDDPAEQKVFVERWLEHARQHDEKVWIITHIPTGYEVFEHYKAWFAKIYTKYEGVIKASFHGHTHDDQFYIHRDLNDENRRPVHVDFVCPAFEGLFFNHPSVRLYQYDDVTKDVVDYTTYISSFDEMRISRKLEWKEFYHAKEEFGIPDLTPKSILHWAEKLWDDEEAFQEYMRTFFTGVYKKYLCVDECKVEMMCDLLYMMKDDREKCIADHPVPSKTVLEEGKEKISFSELRKMMKN